MKVSINAHVPIEMLCYLSMGTTKMLAIPTPNSAISHLTGETKIAARDEKVRYE